MLAPNDIDPTGQEFPRSAGKPLLKSRTSSDPHRTPLGLTGSQGDDEQRFASIFDQKQMDRDLIDQGPRRFGSPLKQSAADTWILTVMLGDHVADHAMHLRMTAQ